MLYHKLDNIFLTLMCCINDVIECDGDNSYQIFHMNKVQLEPCGQLPLAIRVITHPNIMEILQDAATEEV